MARIAADVARLKISTGFSLSDISIFSSFDPAGRVMPRVTQP
jgi:hypothetical protein